MGLRDYLRIVRRGWWIVAIALALAFGVAIVVNMRMPRVYAAGVTFFFTTPEAAPADLFPAGMFSQARLKSYAALLTSDRIVDPLVGTPGVGLSARQIRDRITATAIADTVMLEVTVEDRSRQRAELLVTALMVRFESVVRSLENAATDDRPRVGVQVVAGPRLADEPVSPQPLNNFALALMAGLILGAGSAVVREVSDSTIHSSDALRSLVSAPVLARVPVDADAPSLSGPFVSDSNSARAEALRQLRTNLLYAEPDRPAKILAVTSAVPGEGRSATACSLAMLFAESGRRVLIIDAELRHPRLAAFLGRAGSAGLSTVLSGTASVEKVLQPWGAGLWLLPSGNRPPNPSELLSSQRMTELVDELRERFDIVIVDCPPVLPVTDAAVIAARADGALLVVRSQKTKGAQVTAAVRSLRAANACIIGCVLNMVPLKDTDAFPEFGEYSSTPAQTETAAPAPAGRSWWWNTWQPAAVSGAAVAWHVAA